MMIDRYNLKVPDRYDGFEQEVNMMITTAKMMGYKVYIDVTTLATFREDRSHIKDKICIRMVRSKLAHNLYFKRDNKLNLMEMQYFEDSLHGYILKEEGTNYIEIMGKVMKAL